MFDTGQPLELEALSTRHQGQQRSLHLSIHYRHDRLHGPLAMVSFHAAVSIDAGPSQETQHSPTTLIVDHDNDNALQQLEDELRITREELQAIVAEQASSNEELKVANEEVMSINEELQATNEELETSKEELQSLNEELHTLNQELREKVEDLEQANNDIVNLLNSTDMATLFLDENLRIKRFTPPATQLFRLIRSDLGRPLADLAQQFADTTLLDDAQQVLQEHSSRTRLVEDHHNQAFMRRVLPYRTEEGTIAGVVLTFNNVTELRRRIRQQALIAELGRSALENPDPSTLMQELSAKVAEGLAVPFCKILERLDEPPVMIVRAGVGWRPGVVGKARVDAQDSQASYTLQLDSSGEGALTVGEVVYVDDLRTEQRFHGPSLLTDHGVISGISVAIPGPGGAFGVLGAHSDEFRRFSQEDGDFLRAAAHILGNALYRHKDQLKLQHRAEEMQALLDTLPVAVYFAHDPEARMISGNPAGAALLRMSPGNNLSKTALNGERPGHFQVQREDQELVDATLPVQRAARGESVRNEAIEMVFDNGDVVHGLVSATPLQDEQGRVRGAVAAIQDITPLHLSEVALRHEKDRIQVTLASIGDGVISTDPEHRVEYLNPSAEALTGWTLEQAQGQPLERVLRILNDKTDQPIHAWEIEQLIGEDSTGSMTDIILESDRQQTYVVEISASLIRDAKGTRRGMVLALRDVSEQRKLAQEIYHQAHHDLLTGLPNRREFERRLQRLMDASHDSEANHVVFYMDLDRFKIVNDTCGHLAGDELLRQVAKLFTSQTRQRDTIARLGGDEFGILLEHCTVTQAEKVADSLCQALRDFRFIWESRSFQLTLSIGIVPVHGEGDDLAGIIQAADNSCYIAKNTGRNGYHVYDPEDQAVIQRRGELQWLVQIQRALAENRFQLWVQQIMPVNAIEDPPLRVEILLRMVNSDGEQVGPERFIPAVERYQLGAQLDRWVIDKTFQWLRQRERHLPPLALCSLNLSGSSLGDRQFQDYLLSQLDLGGFPVNCLCFEITEMAAIGNIAEITPFVQALRQRGCQIALDDFGSGFSSFAYLKLLPMDYLKIDGQFVRAILHDVVDRSMVRSISEIAQLMDIRTVAECVEDSEILPVLQEQQIDYAQGFALHRPEPLDTFSQHR